jgi:uncharacterized integral membrane protein
MIVIVLLFAVAGLLAVTFVGGLPLNQNKR